MWVLVVRSSRLLETKFWLDLVPTSPQYNTYVVNTGSGTTALYVDGGITATGTIAGQDMTVTNSLTVTNLNVTGVTTIAGEAHQSRRCLYTV